MQVFCQGANITARGATDGNRRAERGGAILTPTDPRREAKNLLLEFLALGT